MDSPSTPNFVLGPDKKPHYVVGSTELRECSKILGLTCGPVIRLRQTSRVDESAIWDEFLCRYLPLALKLPYGGFGHEYDYEMGPECAAAKARYRERFYALRGAHEKSSIGLRSKP